VTEPVVAVVVRVGTPGLPAFQLRKGEEGLSVFDPTGVDPPLTDEEIIDAFRPDSVVVYRTVDQIAALGLEVVPTEGAETLPDRLRISHREVRPGTGMARAAFKKSLKDLE
jgi:hypothetical protein